MLKRTCFNIVYKLFDKTSKAKCTYTTLKSKVKPNQQLADELCKPIIKKFQKRKLYSYFMNKTWGTDLADMICSYKTDIKKNFF